MDTSDIQHVVELNSNRHGPCEECEGMWRVAGTEYSVTEHANHYVRQHGYRILHVGQLTSEDSEGRLWQSTAIIVGTTDRTNVERMAVERKQQWEEFRKPAGQKE